jgi:biopolymer transport protein TolQ
MGRARLRLPVFADRSGVLTGDLAKAPALSQRRIAYTEARLRTLGDFLLALQVEGATAPSLAGGMIGLVKTVPALVVLGMLTAFSIASWGIILYKLWSFGRISSQSSRFLEAFRRSAKFSEVQAICQSLHESPLVGIFQAGYAELNLQLRQANANPMSNPGPASPRPVLKSLAAVDRALLRASNVEVNKLEKRITFLATTAAVSPFIGLFGTVWGIIGAFQGIAQTGSTSLGTVAPGIAEALVTTAAGLAAAIPAVYFYNLLTQRVKLFATEMDDFSLEFLNIVERNFS